MALNDGDHHDSSDGGITPVPPDGGDTPVPDDGGDTCSTR